MSIASRPRKSASSVRGGMFGRPPSNNNPGSVRAFFASMPLLTELGRLGAACLTIDMALLAELFLPESIPLKTARNQHLSCHLKPPPRLDRRNFLRRSLLSGLALSTFALRAQQNSSSPADFTVFLRSVLAESGLAAIAASAMRESSLLALSAVGVRKVGDKTPVTSADKFHIGSCTKAMTASVAAMLVEQKKLEWKTTLASIFPERASKMHEGFRATTLEMLLTHRAGLPHDGNYAALPQIEIIQQRLACLDSLT